MHLPKRTAPKPALMLAILLLTAAPAVRAAEADAPLFSCTFDEKGWDRADWVLTSRPDWNRVGDWIQRDGFIENVTPEDATEDEMVSKRAKDTFTSMVLKDKVKGDVTITSTMDFAHRMAPSIVLAAKLAKDEKSLTQYHEHYEIVLFDQGVNVWRHVYADGKCSWEKRAYLRFPLEKDTRYTLSVTKKGKQLIVAVNDVTFAYRDDALPDACQVGITGAEGVNRFYDFTVRQ